MARSVKQKAATRKLIAFNRRRAAPAPRKRARTARVAPRRRAAPVSRRRAPQARRAAPKRRRRRNPATTAGQRQTYARTATMNPRRRRRRVSNPRMSMRRIGNDLLMPAAVGAVGAIANDALFTYLPLPAQLKAPGVMRYTTKAVSAVLMSWLGSFVVNQRTATQLGVGALTCLTAEIARNFLLTTLPMAAPVVGEGVGLYVPGGMGYYNPALPAGGGVGVYVPGANTQALPSLSDPALGTYAATPDGFAYS